jgi:hypothetical protein
LNLRRKARIRKPSTGPFAPLALFELTLFSSFIFVFAALLIQFLLTLYTALVLKFYSITFQYSLFTIIFLSESSTAWTADQIYFVFFSGPVLLSLIGLFLLFVLKRSAYLNWKTKLTLTWTAFLMVNTFPASIVAGVFFFEGFGMAFQWMIASYPVRGIIAFFTLSAMVLFSHFWWRLFIRASYSSEFLEHGENQWIFIRAVYFKPWIFGFIILMLFNWPYDNFFWRTFLLCMGFLSVALIDRRTRMFRKPKIMKSDKKIFSSRYQYFYFLLALILLWVADNIIMSF